MEDGLVHPATLIPTADNNGNPEQVLVIGGDLMVKEDGTIDKDNSSEQIYYRGADGQVHMAYPDKFESGSAPMTIEDYEASLQHQQGQEIATEDVASTVAPTTEEPVANTEEPTTNEEQRQPLFYVGMNVTTSHGKGQITGIDNDGNFIVDYFEDADGNDINERKRYTEDNLKVAAGIEEAQPPVDEQQQPLTDEGAEQPQQPTVEPMPMVKGKDGKDTEEPDFSKAEPTRAHAYIYNEAGLTRKEADQFVQANVDAAVKTLDKAKKKQPKMGTSMSAFKQAKAAIQQELDAAQMNLDYWQAIQNEHLKQESAAMEQAKQEQQARMEAEAQRKAEEQARIEAEKQSTASPVEKKWNKAPKAQGRERTITIPDGTTLKGHYVLAPAGAATASHDPMNGWKSSEGFPTDENGNNVNDRDYEHDSTQRTITEQQAADYDGRAIDDVPIVSNRGIVYSGNGRTMAGNIAAKNGTDAKYIERLRQDADFYGFTPEQLASVGEHGRLMFVPDEELPYTTAVFSKFNAKTTKGQGNTAKAIKAGKQLSATDIRAVVDALSDYGSAATFFASPVGTTSFLRVLQQRGILQPNEAADLITRNEQTGEDTLNKSGQEYVSNIILGTILDQEALAALSNEQAVKNSLLTAMKPLLKANTQLGKYSIKGDISKAAQLVAESRRNGYHSVSSYLSQTGMFGLDPTEKYDEFAQALATSMDAGAEDFRDTLEQYNISAAQADVNLFEPITPEELKASIVEYVKANTPNNNIGTRNVNNKKSEDNGQQGTDKRKQKSTDEQGSDVAESSETGKGDNSSQETGKQNIKKRPVLWEKGANETSATDAAPANVTSEQASQSGEPVGSASNTDNIPDGKVTESSETEQGNEGKPVIDKYKEYLDGIEVKKGKLPKGVKWTDGVEKKTKGGKHRNAETVGAVFVGNDLYVRKKYATDQTIVVKNATSLNANDVVAKFDDDAGGVVSPLLSDVIFEVYQKAGLPINNNGVHLRPLMPTTKEAIHQAEQDVNTNPTEGQKNSYRSGRTITPVDNKADELLWKYDTAQTAEEKAAAVEAFKSFDMAVEIAEREEGLKHLAEKKAQAEKEAAKKRKAAEAHNKQKRERADELRREILKALGFDENFATGATQEQRTEINAALQAALKEGNETVKSLWDELGGLRMEEPRSMATGMIDAVIVLQQRALDKLKDIKKEIDGKKRKQPSQTGKGKATQKSVGGIMQPTEEQRMQGEAIVEIVKDAGLPVSMDVEEMRNALLDKDAQYHAQVSALGKAAKTIKEWLAGGSRGKAFTIELPESTQRKVRQAMGRDFDSHNITANGVAHAKRNHGEQGTKLTDKSIPLRDEDFELIPYIMTAPDRVEKGSTDASGRESVRFYKTLSNGYVVVVEKEYKNSPNDMETITMWAEKSSAATNARSEKNAPDTLVRNAIRSIDAAKIRKDAETAIANDRYLQKMTVFHGSAHFFDHFDHSHMGEGEGAQVHGWGTYVAVDKETSRRYAEGLSPRKATYKGTYGLKEIQEFGIADKEQYELYPIVGIIGYMERHPSWSFDNAQDLFISQTEKSSLYSPSLKEKIIEAARKLQKEDFKTQASRNLYSVEIPDNNGRNYLEERKEYSGDEVQELAERLLKAAETDKELSAANKFAENVLGNGWHGKALYDRLVHWLGSDKAASEFLSRAGFVGIHYFGGQDGECYVIFNENDLKITSHEQFLRTPNGEVYGFVKDGKMYIDPRLLNPNTPIHEYTHLWDTALQKANPKLWARGKELMKQLPLWEEVKNDPAYRDIANNEDLLASEVHSRLSGAEGEKLLDDMVREAASKGRPTETARAMTLAQRIKQWMKDVLKFVRDAFAGKWGSKELESVTVEEFARMPIKDLMRGFNPTAIGKEGHSLANVHNLSQDKLRKALKLGGLANPSVAVIDTAKDGHERYGDISLVASRDMADKRKSGSAGTFSGDAWTPMFPHVERQFGNGGSTAASKAINGLPEEMQAVVRADISMWMDGNENQQGMKYLFLHESGRTPEIVREEPAYSREAHETINRLTAGGKKGLYDFTKEELDEFLKLYIAHKHNGDKAAFDERVEALKKHYRERAQQGNGRRAEIAQMNLEDIEKYGIDPTQASNFIRDVAVDEKKAGRVNAKATLQRAQDVVEDGLMKDYERWEEDFAKRCNIKEVIFDGFTPSGNRRYVPNTLENVSRLMKKQGRKGSSGLASFNNFCATLLKEMKTESAIRNEKGKLTGNIEDTTAFLNKWYPTYQKIAARLNEGYSAWDDVGDWRLLEAVAKRDPVRYMEQEYGVKLTEEEKAEFDAMVKAIRDERPAAYFETKFERPVYLNEFVKAVVPNDIAPDLREALEGAGLQIVEYDKTKAGDRRRALTEAVKDDERVQFRVIKDTAAKSDGDSDKLYRTDDESVLYRIREEEAPRKTGIGYKVFFLKNGKLYPPMVANPNGEETPVGVWLDADAAPIIGQTKTGRNQVKAGGKGTQGGSGALAYRPGWHLGEIPYALQFNRRNPDTGEKELFPKDFVWAEVEYADDVDYQQEAHDAGVNANGKYQHSLAGLPYLPKDGSYKYRTNPNPETDPWIITGAMRVRRVLKPSEVDELVRKAGKEPQKREVGAVDDTTIDSLNKEIEQRRREADSEVTDERISYENGPLAKALGGSYRSARQKKEFAARERQRMQGKVESLAKTLGISNEVEIVNDLNSLDNPKDRKAKGWYDRKTGKITIVVPNHVSVADIEQTMLHEAVAHYGLRKLFGDRFDTFLDNVFRNADESIRKRIVEMAKKHNWDFRTATEEYLAGLAENTNFENMNASWWQKIKSWFLDMLHKLGFEGLETEKDLSDNELRYILWRSYENLKEPSRYRNPISTARDVVMQDKLSVGNYRKSEERRVEGEELAAEPLSDIEAVNRRFNEELAGLTEENADNTALRLGRPSAILRAAGVEDKPMKLYGNKVMKKMRKHGFTLEELKDLPQAVADPIAVFNNYQKDGNRSVLTELKTSQGNFLVTIDLGKDGDIDFNIVSSVFGKSGNSVIDWINKGYATYINKEKAQEFLFHQSAPIAATAANSELNSQSSDNLHLSESSISEASSNQELISAAKVIENFDNPSISEENLQENDENVRFRQIDDDERRQWRDVYDKATSGLKFKFSEAGVDGMLSVTKLQDTIAKETGKKIEEAEDVWGHFNHLSSMNKAQEEYYTKNFFEPIQKACRNLVKLGAKYTDEGADIINAPSNILKYIVAKHGLERNKVLAQRDYDDYVQAHPNTTKTLDDFRQRDYSGLKELFDPRNVGEDYEQLAQDYADRFESDFNGGGAVDDLWDKINAATKETLRKTYESGLCSRDYYESAKGMFDYYIPLRGWENDNAADRYHYKGTAGNGGRILQHANGRTTLAKNPLATIGTMGQDAILQGNRNWAKRSLYELAMNHDSALLTVRRQWYQNMGTADAPIWERVYPNLTEGMTADEVDQELKDFEKRMRDLKDAGNARDSRKGLQLTYHTTKPQAQQHRVNVTIGGKEYSIFVNGNPRAAQSINGELRIEDDENSIIEKVKRHLSSVYTSLNPEFVVSNYERDAGFAASIVAATEPVAYQLGWAKNIAVFNPLTNGLYLNHIINKVMSGKADPNSKYETYMKEFLFNGGETGYTSMLTINDYKKLIKRNVKKINAPISPREAENILSGWVERANRVFEDATRFATYVTSREQGRSVFESVKNAKEISLNFNTRGADGMKGDGGWYKFFRNLRRYFIFVNPSIQGLAKAGRAFKTHPVRSTAFLLGAPALLGFGMATIAGMLMGGDGDDDDTTAAYKDLPKWVRRTNICIPAGGTKFVTIPLSYEIRVSYALGEMLWEMQNDMVDKDEVAIETISQLSDLLPMSFMSGTPEQNVSPSMVRPFVEIWQNSDFQGKQIYSDNSFNKNAPEYTKCYAGTSKWIIKSMEMLNNATGGDKYTKGWVERGLDRSQLGKYLNPGSIEHILNSYFGGMFIFPNKIYKSCMGWVMGDEDMKDIRNLPFVSRNLRDSKSGNPSSKGQGSRYYDYMREYRVTKDRFDGYRRETRHGVDEFVPKLTNFLNTPEGRRMQIIDEYKKRKDLDRIEKQIKDIDNYGGDKMERERLKAESNQLKEQMVQELDAMSEE